MTPPPRRPRLEREGGPRRRARGGPRGLRRRPACPSRGRGLRASFGWTGWPRSESRCRTRCPGSGRLPDRGGGQGAHSNTPTLHRRGRSRTTWPGPRSARGMTTCYGRVRARCRGDELAQVEGVGLSGQAQGASGLRPMSRRYGSSQREGQRPAVMGGVPDPGHPLLCARSASS